jgi:hypothetical protein
MKTQQHPAPAGAGGSTSPPPRLRRAVSASLTTGLLVLGLPGCDETEHDDQL